MVDFERLNLKNFTDLNEEAEKLIPSLVASLDDPKKKATLTITLTFKRFKEDSAHVEVVSSVKPAYPSKKKTLLASSDLFGNLSADSYDLGLVRTSAQNELIKQSQVKGD